MIKEKIKPWTGKPIGAPGIVAGMPINHYHARNACIEPSISSGGLRTIFTQSPKHYWIRSPYNPNALEDEETDALRFGRAAHHLLFGQDDFRAEFAVEPPPEELIDGQPFSLRRNVCKVWREQREAEGKTFIKRTELEGIVGMAESLKEHPLVRAGILNGFIETSWFVKHKATGIWIKIRPDAAPNDSLDFVDLKTTSFLDWRSLQNSIYDQGYFIQAGLVAMVVREILNQPLNTFTFMFVDKKPPYECVPVTLKGNEIDRGIKAAEKAIAIFAQCLQTGKWPGRYDNQADAQYIEMAEFHQKAVDAKLENW